MVRSNRAFGGLSNSPKHKFIQIHETVPYSSEIFIIFALKMQSQIRMKINTDQKDRRSVC